MNSVSFQGNITVTTWNKAVSTVKRYNTKPEEDKFIKDIAKNLGEKGEVNSLSKKDANFIYQLVERFTGKEIPKVNNEKVFYNDGKQIVFSDKNPALFDGVRIEVDLS